MNYKIIKSNFDKGLWTKEMVEVAVRKGIITKSQYTQIIGDEEIN